MNRILLVDDDAPLLDVMEQFLRQQNYEVRAVQTGDQALKILEEEGVDLMVTDLVMPDKDGIEIIRDARQKWPALKMVAISGGGQFRSPDFLRIASALGVAATLEKPFSLNDLVKTVSDLIPPTHDLPQNPPVSS